MNLNDWSFGRDYEAQNGGHGYEEDSPSTSYSENEGATVIQATFSLVRSPCLQVVVIEPGCSEHFSKSIIQAENASRGCLDSAAKHATQSFLQLLKPDAQVNIYMGLGLLSMPYAMRLSGWFGLLALLASTAVFCTSAKLLIRAFQTLPAGILHSYPNLGTSSCIVRPL